MYGHSGGFFSGGMFGGGIVMWLFWIILLVVLFYGIKLIVGSFNSKSGSNAPDDALEILKQRYARGEIDEAEFERRKNALQK